MKYATKNLYVVKPSRLLKNNSRYNKIDVVFKQNKKDIDIAFKDPFYKTINNKDLIYGINLTDNKDINYIGLYRNDIVPLKTKLKHNKKIILKEYYNLEELKEISNILKEKERKKEKTKTIKRKIKYD